MSGKEMWGTSCGALGGMRRRMKREEKKKEGKRSEAKAA